jgi:hypothetical protein
VYDITSKFCTSAKFITVLHTKLYSLTTMAYAVKAIKPKADIMPFFYALQTFI